MFALKSSKWDHRIPVPWPLSSSTSPYKTHKTRLNAFTGSCLFNASAVQYRIIVNKFQGCHSQASATSAHCVVFSPTEIIRGPSPHLGMTLKTTFSPLSFGESFMKIRSPFPRTVVSYLCISLWLMEKNKQKNICKTYTHSCHLAAWMRKKHV